MPQLLHVDAVQGSVEEWNEAYRDVRRMNTADTDAVVRHKRYGVGGYCRRAGSAMQEVAHVC